MIQCKTEVCKWRVWGCKDRCCVESWLERLPSIIEGYEARDIWNCDEAGLFWKALPDKGLAEKKKACKGGRKN